VGNARLAAKFLTVGSFIAAMSGKEPARERVRMFIEDSWSFYRRGAEEVKRGLESGDVLRVRDGAEKLWNAVVSAANALVLSYTDTVPASH